MMVVRAEHERRTNHTGVLEPFHNQSAVRSRAVPTIEGVEAMVELRQRDNMLVGFDVTYLPLVISTFRGNLDLESARWHDEAISRVVHQCFAHGRRPLHVIDARHAEAPAAQVRKFWAQRVSQSADTLRRMLGVFVVFDKSTLRGTFTAIDWLCPDANRIECFPTLRDALNLVNVRFAASGYASVDFDPGQYDPTLDAAPPAESYQGVKAGMGATATLKRLATR